MNLFRSIANIFGREPAGAKTASSREDFQAASNLYNPPFEAVEPSTTRANHRFSLWEAKHTYLRASPGDSHAADVYADILASYTDPADRLPYLDVLKRQAPGGE